MAFDQKRLKIIASRIFCRLNPHIWPNNAAQRIIFHNAIDIVEGNGADSINGQISISSSATQQPTDNLDCECS